MSEIYVVNQSEPSTPNSGDSIIYVDASSKTLKSKDSTGTVHDYGLGESSGIENLLSLPHTTVIEGCVPSINSLDNTKFDISSGIIVFTDSHINPSNPTITRYTYAGSIGNTNSRLTTHTESFILIDSSGVIHLTDFPTASNLPNKSWAACGALLHQGKSVIEGTTPACGCIERQIGRGLSEFNSAVGIINLDNGNVYGPNGSNLMINKTAGKIFSVGINRTASDQNTLSIPAFTGSYISYIYQNGLGDFTRTNLSQYIDPSKYDNGSGTLQSVGSKWSVQYIYLPGGFTQIQYGQSLYDDSTSAISAINSVVRNEAPILLNSCFRGWLIVKGTATNLSDSSQAIFYSADKFGNRISTGGIRLGVTTLQMAYNNGSLEPEIKINSTMGAVTFQDSDVSNGTAIIEVKNSNNVKTIFDVQPSVINASEKIKLSDNAIAWEDLRIGGSLRAGVNPAPTFAQVAGLGNLYLYKFGASTLDNLYCTIQLPHNWKEGTDIIPHIHWITEDSNAGNIVWRLEYSWANYNSTYSTSTIVETTVSNSTGLKHNMATFPTISGTGKTISSIILIRLSRNGTAAADTYASSVCLMDFDIHYQIDSLGSSTSTTK